LDALWGRVASGKGEAPRFLAPAWVQAAIAEALGEPAVPGTLNLKVRPRQREAAGRSWPWVALPAQEAGYCDARLYPVRLNRPQAGWVRAVWIRPLVEDYPPDQVELAAGVRVRLFWHLRDDDRLWLAPWAAPAGEEAEKPSPR
jgi:CTP-dependent riboflavin kinase